MKIPFNKPYWSNDELGSIKEALNSHHISGGGDFSRKSEALLCEYTGAKKTLLTTSCTHALEMSAVLLNIEPGDEVIIPSFTFVSSALAFVMQGAVPVFCDIRADTLNIDETKIEELISKRTKAIVVVHYAGVSCEMDAILVLSNKYGLSLIEDNAHGLFGSYKGKSLGSFGHLVT